jgi:hypothetical protein
MSQLIDIEAAREFMKETLAKVDKLILIDIAHMLEKKSLLFRQTLSKDKLLILSQEEFDLVLDKIFSIRRKKEKLFEHISFDNLKKAVYNLLYGSDKINNRFQEFYDILGELDTTLKYDMAGELLHFSNPEKYWLWSRWMWDPKNKTGAIPLVTSEGFDLEGNEISETYMKVGKGVAFVHSVAESAEFQFINRSLFGTDVYLSCVYIIYAYTVLEMKMTKEFNEVMPGLTEFSRRLLGVYDFHKAA